VASRVGGKGPGAKGGDKEALFLSLGDHKKRKEAFAELWNSEFAFSPAEYDELLKTCCRLG
jgi:hypothetical protein